MRHLLSRTPTFAMDSCWFDKETESQQRCEFNRLMKGWKQTTASSSLSALCHQVFFLMAEVWKWKHLFFCLLGRYR